MNLDCNIHDSFIVEVYIGTEGKNFRVFLGEGEAGGNSRIRCDFQACAYLSARIESSGRM